jgi:acetyl-CoA acetyltransferase
MSEVYVVGVGMTPFTRHLDRSVLDLTREAVDGALQDAGGQATAVDMAFFSNTTQSIMEGQHLVPGQVALRKLGFAGIPISNVENACASASTALHHAAMAVRAGMADVALAVGVDKMYSEDRAKSFEIFNGAWDVHDVEATLAGIRAMGAGMEEDGDVLTLSNRKPSPFMEVYAQWGKFHMKTFGTTRRQLAAVASKNHAHSVHNPLAQFRQAMTVDEILAARPIAWPLTLPMCAPISDGAAAAIVCSKSALKRFARDRAISLLACVLGTGVERKPEDIEQHLSRRAALKAYEAAGIGPQDISVAEVHDATAVGEVMQSEFLDLVPMGEGGPAAERGDTALGGRIPINPSGGLESKGHPIGATGLGQIYELVTQLRGEAGARQVEGARFAIAENGGGVYGIEESVTCVSILGRR